METMPESKNILLSINAYISKNVLNCTLYAWMRPVKCKQAQTLVLAQKTTYEMPEPMI